MSVRETACVLFSQKLLKYKVEHHNSEIFDLVRDEALMWTHFSG